MPYIIGNNTYLTTKEGASAFGVSQSTFMNRRARHGDSFLTGYRDLIPGRVLFRLEDVERAVGSTLVFPGHTR